MKCNNRDFIIINPDAKSRKQENQGAFPDTLTDYLSSAEIPFSNRDNIRQKLVKALVEEKGYTREDISLDRQIRFEIEGQQVCSLVDITIRLGNKTLMVCKCASGSVVSRERQIIATARLLEEYIVPFAVVTNGVNIELLDTVSEKVIGMELSSVFTRQELSENIKNITLKPSNKKKLVFEERVLYTYDSICCALPSGNTPASR